MAEYWGVSVVLLGAAFLLFPGEAAGAAAVRHQNARGELQGQDGGEEGDEERGHSGMELQGGEGRAWLRVRLLFPGEAGVNPAPAGMPQTQTQTQQIFTPAEPRARPVVGVIPSVIASADV